MIKMIKRLIDRLGLLIHWIGFLFSVVFILCFPLLMREQQELSAVEIFFELLLDFGSQDWSVILWITIAHWPIKWFITGNTAFFPWRHKS